VGRAAGGAGADLSVVARHTADVVQQVPAHTPGLQIVAVSDAGILNYWEQYQNYAAAFFNMPVYRYRYRILYYTILIR